MSRERIQPPVSDSTSTLPRMMQSSSHPTIAFAAPSSSSRTRAGDPRRFSSSSAIGSQPLSIFSPEDFKRARRPMLSSNNSSSTCSNLTSSNASRLPPSPSILGSQERLLDHSSAKLAPQPRNLSAPPTPLVGSAENTPSVSSMLGSTPTDAERKLSDQALAARLRREAEEEWERYRRTRSLATVGESGAPAPGPGAELAKSALLMRLQQKEQSQLQPPYSNDSRASLGGLDSSRKSSCLSLSRSELSDVVQSQPPYLTRRCHRLGIDELQSISITSPRSSLMLFDTDDEGDEARLLRNSHSLHRLGSGLPSAPLPSTINLLSDEERAREIRRSQKLAQLLGDEVRDGRRPGRSPVPGSPPLPRRGSDPVDSVGSGLRRTANLAKRIARRGSVGAFAHVPLPSVDVAVIDEPPSDIGRKAAAILGLAIVVPPSGPRSSPGSMEFLDDEDERAELKASVDEAPLAATDEREMALARQREERRRRVAKVSRWLGAAVPPHLVHSGKGIPRQQQEQHSASDGELGGSIVRTSRAKLVRSPSEPSALSDAERGLSSPNSAQEHFHNVRRASKLASVFGQAPPRKLFAGASSPSVSSPSIFSPSTANPPPFSHRGNQRAHRESYEASLNSLEYLLEHDQALLGDMIDAMSDGAASEGARRHLSDATSQAIFTAPDEDPVTARPAVTSFLSYDSSDAGSEIEEEAVAAPQGTWSGGEADSSTTSEDESNDELDAVRQSSWLEGRHRQHRAQAARAQKLSRFFGESAAAVLAEENASSCGGLPLASTAPPPSLSRFRPLHRASASQASMSAGVGGRAARGLGRLLDSFEGEACEDPKLSEADRKAIAQRVATLRRRTRGGVSCTAVGNIQHD